MGRSNHFVRCFPYATLASPRVSHALTKMSTLSLSTPLRAQTLSSRSASTATLGKSTVRAPISRKGVAVYAGNANTTGIFAPLVRVARAVIGQKPFNQLRGKGIGLHSQVIGKFCEGIGAEAKVKQRLIRTAKKNGEELGFLA